MNLESPAINTVQSVKKTGKDLFAASRVLLLLVLLLLLSSFFVVVNAGQRGVLMRFGKVQAPVLDEGIHLIIPIVNTVQKLNVRVQKREIFAEASSQDLQNVYTDAVVNWHIIPETANLVFQQIGNELAIVDGIINPAVEEVLKAVMAHYTAEEIITRRGEVKAEVDTAATTRLATYHIAVDDLSLVHIRFTKRFSDAVEAKQVAAQEAKRAEFVALKAKQEAEAKANLARGEAEAQRLLQETLTPELLQRQVIERWSGNLPLIVGGENPKFLDLEQIVKAGETQVKEK